MTIERMLDIRGKTDMVDLSQDAVLHKSDPYDRLSNWEGICEGSMSLLLGLASLAK